MSKLTELRGCFRRESLRRVRGGVVTYAVIFSCPTKLAYCNIMRIGILVPLLLVVVLVQTQKTQPVRRGTTFQATVWPEYHNNYAGRFSCRNCNPFEGDQPCTRRLPLLCINNHKSLDRPFYQIAIEYTPFQVTDGGYYDGWTGGVFEVTSPIRGQDITSYQAGDELCKGFFGDSSKFASWDDGYYMSYMNERPIKAWNLWSWDQTKQGRWNMWGYFNHHYRGRAWVWARGQSGNCGA